jgi:hypothetical protein
MVGRRIVRRRMLLRGAVVAGGAYAVGKGVQRGRDADAQAEAAQPVEEAPQAQQAAVTEDTVEQLQQLAELKKQGILTDEEFAEQKARILGS